MDSKFNTLIESNFTRFQGGGFLTGDVIKFKDGWKSDPWCSKAPAQVLDTIQSMIDADLNIRVSSVKTLRPSVNSNADQAQGADGFLVDVVLEPSPGRYTSFITVPQELIEIDGPNDAPPALRDSQKRKETVTIKPEEVGVGSEETPLNPVYGTQSNVGDKSLPSKNTKLAGAKGAKSYTAKYIG
tara:strand:+ start:453 stop:1007 length:555 start_codon:yes stop_codon:yes gene_type:complete